MMKRKYLTPFFVIVVCMIVLLTACGGTSGNGNLLLETEITYENISQAAFSSGGILAGGRYNQMKRNMIIYVLTSGRKYGYLKIDTFDNDLVFQTVIYDDEGNPIISQKNTLSNNEHIDLDQDGVVDLEWTFTEQVMGRNSSARFARLSDYQYLKFIDDVNQDIGTLYALEEKTAEMEQSGITYIYPEEGKIVGVSTNYEESDAVPTTDSQIAYVKTDTFPEYRAGDVIIDYENLKLRKLTSDPLDEGNYIVMQTEGGTFDDVFNKFEFNGETSVSELEVVEANPTDTSVSVKRSVLNKELEFKINVGPKFLADIFGEHVKAGVSGDYEMPVSLKGVSTPISDWGKMKAIKCLKPIGLAKMPLALNQA